MDKCEYCNHDLISSRYLLNGADLLKSCPDCSRHQKCHIYYPCPDSFGFRKESIQTHCTRCRAQTVNKQRPFNNHISCSDAIDLGYHLINSVRLLPISSKIMEYYGGFETFFMKVLPERGYKYYFNKKIKDSGGALVIFQFMGTVCGHAIVSNEVLFPEPTFIDSFEYMGYYTFYSNSIVLYSEPISLEEFKKISPRIVSFNQSFQKLNVSVIPRLINHIKINDSVQKIASTSDVYPEEFLDNELPLLKEGAKTQITVNAYERNLEAKRLCVEHNMDSDGNICCKICGFDFGKTYGLDFRGLIHVHHIREISSIGEEYVIDPICDLIPVCPNCHAALHHRRPAYSIDYLTKILKK